MKKEKLRHVPGHFIQMTKFLKPSKATISQVSMRVSTGVHRMRTFERFSNQKYRLQIISEHVTNQSC
jgi:hypothetical protein